MERPNLEYFRTGGADFVRIIANGRVIQSVGYKADQLRRLSRRRVDAIAATFSMMV